MFERFTRETRLLVLQAVEEATSHQHKRAGTGHILTAMFADTTGPVSEVLTLTGASLDRARVALREVSGPSTSGFDDLDAQALQRVGINLDEIRGTVDDQFGPGALDRRPRPQATRRLTEAAKEATFLAFKEAKQLRQRRMDSRHLLLALLDQPGPTAAQLILDRLGVDRADLRTSLMETLRG
jgi:ATP-dependent Clp protease ATP-binding subunit ClpA